MDTALLIVRLILGLGMAAHGTQKLFGWFGGYGLQGTGGFFESIGFRPGKLFALAAGLGEFSSGLLVAIGFLGPIGPAIMISVMLVAILTVHRSGGFFATSNGIELPLVYAVSAFVLAFTGPGAFALDSLFGLQSLWTQQITWIAVGIAIVSAVANLAVRRAPAAQHA